MYLKSDVSRCVCHDVKLPALSDKIDRLGEELRDHRKRLHEVELFQIVIKVLLIAAGVMVSILLTAKILNTSTTDPPTSATPKAEASQPADATASAPQ
jgi:hypothetical protein